MSMSEHDLRVLSEIETDLELMDLSRRRRLPERRLLLAASGLFVGAVFIAVGLWVTATVGTVAAVGGFVLIVGASHHMVIQTQRAWFARSSGRGMWSHSPSQNR